jgi:hypothetical protein
VSTPQRVTVEFDSERERDEFLYLCRYRPETWPVKIRRVISTPELLPAESLASSPLQA